MIVSRQEVQIQSNPSTILYSDMVQKTLKTFLVKELEQTRKTFKNIGW